jgi:Rrf2 family iron-sulfur cluster assembly transcriptional regulator
MDIVRRNTDYALRIMIHLARCDGYESVSCRTISDRQVVPYQLSCKLMQKLHGAGLVKSCMGVKGGFQLNKHPSKISLLDIIETVQKPVCLNRCVLSVSSCSRKKVCTVRPKLTKLQNYISNYLAQISLAELAEGSKISYKKRAMK